MNYYTDLWTKQGKDGAEFFRRVDFNTKEYQLQEHIFRQTLVSLKSLIKYGIQKPIESVLELGAGTGRMTKIMLEEFPNLKRYCLTDIKPDFNKIRDVFPKTQEIGIFQLDITTNEFDRVMKGKQYDIVLASEIFMHIKPQDVESVLKRVTSLLAPNGLILNIDWSFDKYPSEWCFIHDYDKLYRENGLHAVFTADIKEIRQKLFCYGA